MSNLIIDILKAIFITAFIMGIVLFIALGLSSYREETIQQKNIACHKIGFEGYVDNNLRSKYCFDKEDNAFKVIMVNEGEYYNAFIIKEVRE